MRSSSLDRADRVKRAGRSTGLDGIDITQENYLAQFWPKKEDDCRRIRRKQVCTPYGVVSLVHNRLDRAANFGTAPNMPSRGSSANLLISELGVGVGELCISNLDTA